MRCFQWEYGLEGSEMWTGKAGSRSENQMTEYILGLRRCERELQREGLAALQGTHAHWGRGEDKRGPSSQRNNPALLCIGASDLRLPKSETCPTSASTEETQTPGARDN